MGRHFGGGNKGPRRPTPARPQEEIDALVRRLRTEGAGGENYREKSLKLHGWICAKCGREFDSRNLQLLTVHHKDGNHANNPPDGSNWENLCIDCHDDEHSRSLLGDYLSGRGSGHKP
jgi:5-methylcytosine-specific restriction endonuclease McrA